MDLPPFLLDHWLSTWDFAQPPIAFNLASSTGPRWSVGALAALSGAPPDVAATLLGYAPPEGGRALREQVGDFHGVEADVVVMTTGSSEALSILMCLLAREGGNVVVPDPGYPAYGPLATAWGLAVRPYVLDAGAGFEQGAEGVLAACDARTVAAVVNTPHNPTGSVMERGEIERLAGALAARGAPLIVDEVYHPLYFGERRASAAGLGNVIVTSDLSKAFSLPGLRTGWIVDPDAARRARIVDARSYFTVSGSPVLEALAACAVRERGRILARLEAVAGANLTLLDRLMAKAEGVLSWVRPRGGATCFPWFVDRRDSRPFCQALAEKGVLVAPGDCFGHRAHFRLGFAQQAEGFEAAVEIVGDQLSAG